MKPNYLLLFLAGLASPWLVPAMRAQGAPQYILIDLCPPDAQGGLAAAVNESGQAVGSFDPPSGNDRGFLWSGGRLMRLDPPGGVISQAFGINDEGVVVGITSATLSGPPRPTRWRDGAAEDLGTLGGPGGYAYAINNAGMIVGTAAPPSGAPRAYRLVDGTMDDIGTGIASTAFALNEAGWIAGVRFIAPGDAGRRAVLWNISGGWIQPEFVRAGPSAFHDVNAGRIAVGVSQDVDGNDRAMKFTANGSLLEDLGTGWGTHSAAFSINDSGWIVGAIAGATPPSRGFLHIDGVFHDLNNGLLGAEGWTVTSARAINNRGWIAGGARDSSGVQHAVLLVPRTLAVSALVNLSIRAGLQPGRPVIAGVSVGGLGGRMLLARGVGPGLEPFLPEGVPAALDTRITVFDKAGEPEVSNDDWSATAEISAAARDVGAFGLGSGSHDAALLHAFTEQRTIHLGATGEGVGLVEVYDTRRTSNIARLVNLSARYHVGVGDDVLIAGFVIEGAGPKALLIRGVGPGLEGLVDGHLLDSRIAVYDANGAVIAENDDWAANLASVFDAAHAFALPAGSKDAALVVSLEPGAYTVHLSGGPADTGEGLIEVYDLDL